MNRRRDLVNVWKNIQELDLRPIRDSAEQEVTLAIVGTSEVGKRVLASQLRTDPDRPDVATLTPIIIAEPDTAEQAMLADAIILLIDSTAGNVQSEQALIDRWLNAAKRVIVLYTNTGQIAGDGAVIPWLETGPAPKIYGEVADRNFLQRDLIPLLLKYLPEQHMALGRHFPLLRETIARELINDTCFANAAYSVGTGLAEIIPVLDLPLNVADMIVLTKAQAILVYKLGLALGMSTDWQYYVGEFSSVIGGGFIWRQVARSLIGLIPVWGIVPKVAVAYSGTFVVGHTILRWYLTGRHLSKKQMRELSGQAFDQGKAIGRSLLDKLPRPSLRRKKTLELPPPENICQNCSTVNDDDAVFCKQCGESLEYASQEPPSEEE